MFPSNIPSRKSLVTLSCLLLQASALALFGGCLSDPITGPEVRARLVLPPLLVRFSSPPSSWDGNVSGDMVIRWTRSPADTQLNFKGYYVRLWTSIYNNDTILHQITQPLVQLVDTAHVRRVTGRLDTSVTFHSIPMGTYSAIVWGEKATDTLGYSLDSAQANFYFDPRPLQNPTNLRATSTGTNGVDLEWDPAASHRDSGSCGYAFYYRDPDKRNDSAHYICNTGLVRDTTAWLISVPSLVNSLRGAFEHEYQIWVKSVRNDSAYFYGQDTNSIVWAGAEVSPLLTAFAYDTGGRVDSGTHRFRRSLYIGSVNNVWGESDDSIDGNAQVGITINGATVALTTKNGAAFLNDGGGSARMDTAYNLSSIFYSTPLADPSQFTIASATLPDQSTATGVVLYLMFKDYSWSGQNEWARIFVARHKDGTFVDPAGGIDLQVSFQPGVKNDVSGHFPYY